ncbi:hypothetical protein GWI33_001945 [Rhynchophorus ferrugineus]|uniref:Uncharacterized protein n=1 Tax=Rhynchophorus ferrugineus TaxID=354439 RepID=A0A834IKU9_RHYFE|nr:hypothetical protein GWI33_001945 [Rhynchophorus ferrugineus]
MIVHEIIGMAKMRRFVVLARRAKKLWLPNGGEQVRLVATLKVHKKPTRGAKIGVGSGEIRPQTCQPERPTVGERNAKVADLAIALINTERQFFRRQRRHTAQADWSSGLRGVGIHPPDDVVASSGDSPRLANSTLPLLRDVAHALPWRNKTQLTTQDWDAEIY